MERCIDFKLGHVDLRYDKIAIVRSQLNCIFSASAIEKKLAQYWFSRMRAVALKAFLSVFMDNASLAIARRKLSRN